MRFADAFKENFWTISNFLSVTRVLLLPLYVWLGGPYRENPTAFWLRLLLLLVLFAILSDFLDGFLARLLRQETMVGRYLDPICDKLVTLVAMLDSALHYGFPWFVFFFCVVREILGVWMGTFLYFKRDIQGRPNIWGKIGVGVVAIAAVWHVSVPYMKAQGFEGLWTQPVYSAWAIFAVFFIGMIAYTVTYWDIILHGKNSKSA